MQNKMSPVLGGLSDNNTASTMRISSDTEAYTNVSSSQADSTGNITDLSADALSDNNRSGGSTNGKSAITYSISDLYTLVKAYDKDFHAKEANPTLLEEIGGLDFYTDQCNWTTQLFKYLAKH